MYNLEYINQGVEWTFMNLSGSNYIDLRIGTNYIMVGIVVAIICSYSNKFTK